MQSRPLSDGESGDVKAGRLETIAARLEWAEQTATIASVQRRKALRYFASSMTSMALTSA